MNRTALATVATAVTLAASAPPAGGLSQRAEIRLAALTASGAADALDDLQAVDDPDAAGVRTEFRNATRLALEAASKAYDASPAIAATAFDLSLEAAEAAERFGDAFASALEARGELEAVVPEAVQTKAALDEARRANSVFRAAQIAREAVLAELSCHRSDGCPPPVGDLTTSHDWASTHLVTASWLAVEAAQVGNVGAAQAAHAAVLAEVAGDHAAANAARVDVLVALGVSSAIAQAALDAYLVFEDADGGSRCMLAADVVLPVRRVRAALADPEGGEIADKILQDWEFFDCYERISGQFETEREQRYAEQCRQAKASGDRRRISTDCYLHDSLSRLSRDRQKARDRQRQSSIDTAQTLRLAAVEALLDVQSGVGNLDGAIDVLAEGASVAGDRSVDAAVSAASAMVEAETHLDEAVRAYRRAAAAWRALLAQ